MAGALLQLTHWTSATDSAVHLYTRAASVLAKAPSGAKAASAPRCCIKVVCLHNFRCHDSLQDELCNAVTLFDLHSGCTVSNVHSCFV